jgi:hypothetical protein
MPLWANKKVNTNIEKQAKSIPCHVTKVDKDFITVAFETQNGIFTPPTVKIPQSMSQYGRDPTQVGDKGYAVPGDYYLGGVTGDAGGNTNFYPRGNLTTLSFQHVSHKQNPDRDVDQLTHMGGPNGWTVGAFKKQQQDQQQNGGESGTVGTAATAATFFRTTSSFRAQQQSLRKVISPMDLGGITGGGGSSGSSGQQQEDDNQTNFSFDKDNVCMMQSKSKDYQVTCDEKSGKITLKVPTGKKVYVGGDGSEGQYAQLVTTKGPVINALGRIG